MKKYISHLLFLILLVGCQSQSVNSDTLHEDAETVFLIIENASTGKGYLDEDESDQVKTFQSTYLDHIKDYPSDEELLSNMEKLVYSYTFYRTSTGLKDTDAMKMYQARLNESIKELDKQFNK